MGQIAGSWYQVAILFGRLKYTAKFKQRKRCMKCVFWRFKKSNTWKPGRNIVCCGFVGHGVCYLCFSITLKPHLQNISHNEKAQKVEIVFFHLKSIAFAYNGHWYVMPQCVCYNVVPSSLKQPPWISQNLYFFVVKCARSHIYFCAKTTFRSILQQTSGLSDLGLLRMKV